MRRSPGATALLVVFVLTCGTAPLAGAALSVVSQFNPTDAAGLCGVAADPSNQSVRLYPCSGTHVRQYSSAGTFLAAATRPGEAADDVDLEIARVALVLGVTPVPAGTLLVINGESGPADIYALDPTSGAVLATLPTLFGASHVVGGAWHPGRNTFFLVQDRNGSAPNGNRVAEIDPTNGAILNSFSTIGIFDVNYGDLDVCNTSGNLLLVSSVETRMVELTPAGTLVQYHPLPAGVSDLSGLGHDDVMAEAWVASPGGNVWRLGGIPCATVSVPDGDASPRAALAPPRPNPSTGAVALAFTLSEDVDVTVSVHDVAGRRVRMLAAGELPSGPHEIRWDALDERGERVRPGVYFYRLTAGAWRGERRCVIVAP
ncbi:MAG: FlgD immunoglobulin-like domain containing protein [Candidatus Eiseniibacteriota bacterium]